MEVPYFIKIFPAYDKNALESTIFPQTGEFSELNIC